MIRIKTETCPGKIHPIVVVINDDVEFRGCGDSWCNGDCGLPALVVKNNEAEELKVYSSMTAVGSVLQSFRINWIGDKITLPDSVAQYLSTRYWT